MAGIKNRVSDPRRAFLAHRETGEADARQKNLKLLADRADPDALMGVRLRLSRHDIPQRVLNREDMLDRESERGPHDKDLVSTRPVVPTGPVHPARRPTGRDRMGHRRQCWQSGCCSLHRLLDLICWNWLDLKSAAGHLKSIVSYRAENALVYPICQKENYCEQTCFLFPCCRNNLRCNSDVICSYNLRPGV